MRRRHRRGLPSPRHHLFATNAAKVYLPLTLLPSGSRCACGRCSGVAGDESPRLSRHRRRPGEGRSWTAVFECHVEHLGGMAAGTARRLRTKPATSDGVTDSVRPPSPWHRRRAQCRRLQIWRPRRWVPLRHQQTALPGTSPRSDNEVHQSPPMPGDTVHRNAGVMAQAGRFEMAARRASPSPTSTAPAIPVTGADGYQSRSQSFRSMRSA